MTDEPGTLRLRPGMRGGGPGVMQRTPETPHYDVYRSYYYLGGQRIAQRRQSATLFLDELLYLFTDHLGTVRLETYGNGPSEGQMRAATPTLPYGGQRYAAPESHHWYTGQRFDVGTGLYFYQSRWYDPLVGRFVSPDSIVPNPGNPQSLNRYSYVANNPMRYTDPTGHANECGATGEDCGGGGYVWTPPTAAPSVTGTPAPSFPGAPPVPAPELPAPTPLTSAGTPVPYSSTSSSIIGPENRTTC